MTNQARSRCMGEIFPCEMSYREQRMACTALGQEPGRFFLERESALPESAGIMGWTPVILLLTDLPQRIEMGEHPVKRPGVALSDIGTEHKKVVKCGLVGEPEMALCEEQSKVE